MIFIARRIISFQLSGLFSQNARQILFFFLYKAIPIKCFVSHRPPSRKGGSVGRAKKKIGPQCVRVATAFLFALVCEYDVVEYVQLF